MRKKLTLFLSSIILLPMLVNAQQLNQINNANDLKARLVGIADVVIYILVAFAVLFIVYNVVRYLVMGNNPEEKSKNSLNILWGIIGLFIIVSIWGLVNILVGTFSTNNAVPRDRFPTTNFVNGTNRQTFEAPSAANNWNTNITGGNENTQNYNH